VLATLRNYIAITILVQTIAVRIPDACSASRAQPLNRASYLSSSSSAALIMGTAE
jgi:hypothetical protein